MVEQAKHTQGPWEWQSFDGGETIFLGTPNRVRLVVMDFVRKGMNRAQPRFAINRNGEDIGGLMRCAAELDVENHADARLIAAAPDLLSAIQGILNVPEAVKALANWGCYELIAARVAVAKATSVNP